jgi:hypothetical protein
VSIHEQRQIVRHMLDDASIIDAPTAYYALYHDSSRSTIVSTVDRAGRPQGFVGRFQTGYDLFRPLVTMRCRTAEIAADLLAQVLTPGRPYIFFANLNQLPLIGGSFSSENQRILHIYYLDSTRFQPKVNVMVVEKTTEEGQPRFEIHSGGLQAVSGVNWISPGFAEVYVYTEPLARQRGWGRSVVAACTEHILRSGRLPLYLVETDNPDSILLAQSLGYVDSGARQIYADVIYLGHPGQQAQVRVEQNDQTNQS